MQLLGDIIRFFNFVGSLICHQKPERTLWIGGHYLPVCARDTGVFIGLLTGYALLLFLRRRKARGPPNLYLTSAMILPLFIDSFAQLFGFWTSTNDVRLLTGLLFGTALAPMLVYALSMFPLNGKIPLLRRIQPETAILDDKNSWFDARALSFGIVLSIIVFVIIRSIVGNDFVLFYWLLSVPIVSGAIWHLFLLPILLLIVCIKQLLHARSEWTQR